MDDKGGLVSQELKIKCEYTELVEIHKLVENPKNANKHTKEQIDRLAKILQFQGWRHPVIVSKRSGFICAGHGRLLAAKLLKQESVPVDYQDFLTEAEEYAFVIADNEIARWAEFDEQKFIEDVANIDIGDIDLFGLKEVPDLLQDEKQELTDPDDVPEVEQNIHNVQLGQIYKLGEHRLMCGDSTKIEDVEKLMDGNKADMVFTDPPYNVDYEGKTEDALKIKNDKMGDSEFKDFLQKVFKNYISVSKPGSAIYVCHADSNGLVFRSTLVEAGWLLKQCLVWVKQMFVMGRQDYHWQHEPILYGWMPGAAHRWFGNRKQSTLWQFERPRRSLEHPTMKPVEMIQHALSNSSKKEDLVIDFFGGSGSTLIACEKTNRKCYGMELDPHYCSVIIERWQQFTGKKAELLNG